MEQLLVLFIQFWLEFTINVVSIVPFDWFSKNRTTAEPESIASRCFLWFLEGCILAGVSLLILKHTIISVMALRIANLVLAPIVSAYITEAIARRRAKINPFIAPCNHFWQAFWFTFGLVVIRFIYASRA